MRLISWNINGLRARMISHIIPFLKKEQPDILLLQEIKAEQQQVPNLFLADLGYQTFWHSAARPGYSGVSIFTKVKPCNILYGINDQEIDIEGRVLTIDIGDLSIVNAYFPHSHRQLKRLQNKIYFLDKILEYLKNRQKAGFKIIIGGDFNIAHNEIDLRNPRQNYENAGFRPEERSWIDKFIASGYVDSFRVFCQDGGNYTWWSYREGVRERNVGWRIDYFFVDSRLCKRITKAAILADVYGSDHCPILLEISEDI